MAVPISNVTRRAVYAPSGAGGVGPYAFTFEILANTDIAVFKDDVLLTLTTHYTVTINANGTGSVTITAAGLALSPVSPTQYAIVGNRTISRTTDFTTGGDFFANTINDELDQQTIFAQQNAEGVTRALQAPQTDPTTIDMTLPRSSVRAGKVLSFDASGNPSATEFIGSNRGNWATATLYYVRDIIKDTSTSNIWQCVTEHTSSGSQPIASNADAAKWFLLVNAAAAGAAQAAAEVAQAAAETAQAAAETAETNAETAETNAETAATASASSASAASTSASNASSSASTASTAATNAGNSATAAASSASSASSSASSASSSASSASTSASNASTSASNASTSATNAASNASSASSSASTATTQATNASNSATASASSATAAAASAAAAAASFDAFDDIYLGAKSSDPALDNDGNALTTGDQYFNTTANELRVYNGSTWQAASTVGGTVTSLNVAGVASFADGSAAAPSITNDGDTNTGIFFPAADTIAFSEGGVEAMRINSSGNVGIGTSSPAVSGVEISRATGYATPTPAELRISTTTNESGWSTTDPWGRLSFYSADPSAGGAGLHAAIQTTATGFTGGVSRMEFLVSDNTNKTLFKTLEFTPVGTNTTQTIFYSGSGTERMRIDSDGNVGIGTSSPATALHVTGASRTQRIGSSYAYEWYVSSTNRYFLTDVTNAAERLCIDNAGNVGIGTSSPATQLVLAGNNEALAENNTLRFWDTDNGTEANQQIGKIEFYSSDASTPGASVKAYIGAFATDTTPDAYLAFATATTIGSVTERMRIDNVGNVGIGTSSPSRLLDIATSNAGGSTLVSLVSATDGNCQLLFGDTESDTQGKVLYNNSGDYMAFNTADTERARITSAGEVLVGTTSETQPGVGNNTVGISLRSTQFYASSTGTPGFFSRTVDGSLVSFQQGGTTEGSISVSGTTVSYNGGHLSRWAQTTTAKDESLVKGTVLSNLDEMNVYTDAEGNPVDNEQLNKVKVSDVEGDANVAGVFVNWTHDEDHNVDEINMAMTGDMIIRIAQGTTVARGDLLMSAGDGTAKPQGDDIVRSKTIAKVTSTHVTCTYADGSFCVPCVLMAC